MSQGWQEEIKSMHTKTIAHQFGMVSLAFHEAYHMGRPVS